MSLHHGLTDLRNDHFTEGSILPWFRHLTKPLSAGQTYIETALWAQSND